MTDPGAGQPRGEPAPDLARVANQLVTAARAALGVRRAALFLRSADGAGLVCVATAGEGDAARWVGQTLRAGVGVAGRAVAEGRPVWSPDLLADTRIPVAAWLRERLEAEGLRSVMAAPLTADGETVGALGILESATRAYTPEDNERLATLAREAAPGIRRACSGRADC